MILRGRRMVEGWSKDSRRIAYQLRSLFLIILLGSCVSYPEAIEDVLRQAGNNRKEIENLCEDKTWQGETPKVQNGAALPP